MGLAGAALSGCNCGPASGCPPAGTPGLELCLDFLSDTPTTIHDRVNAARTGKVTGALSFVDGKGGRAAKFDGASGERVDFGSVLHLADAVTVEAWVDPERAQGWDTVVSNWTGRSGYWLGLSSEPGGFEWWVDVTHIQTVAGATPGWHHLAGTYDAASGELTLVVDGKVAVRDATSHAAVPMEPAAASLLLAQGGDEFSPWTGLLSQVRIWSVARTPAQLCESAGGAAAPGGDCRDAPLPARFSPAVGDLLDQGQRLADGRGADFDGDRVDEWTVATEPDGTVRTQADEDADGVPEYVRTVDPAGTAVTLFDLDQDGFAEAKETRTATTFEALEDRDHDLRYERRRTNRLDATRRWWEAVLEQDLALNGTFVEQARFTYSVDRPKCGVRPPGGSPPAVTDCVDLDPVTGEDICATARYPTGPPNPSRSRGQVSVFGNGTDQDAPYPSGDGSCSDPHADKLVAALDCAIGRAHGCLKAANQKEGLRFDADVLASKALIRIACGTRKRAGERADHTPCTCGAPAFAAPGDHVVEFDPRLLDGTDADGACSAMLHELMHMAGTEDDDLHDDGVDRIYACGRYCGGSKGCHYVTSATAGNYPADCFDETDVDKANQDCLKCAGPSPAERALCGTRSRDVAASPISAVCNPGTLACIAQPCNDTLRFAVQLCDGWELGASLPCCQACPDSACSNSLPCTGRPPPENGCKKPPTGCP